MKRTIGGRPRRRVRTLFEPGSWGVTAFVVPFDLINPENTIESALKSLSQQGRLHAGNTIVVIGSILVGEQIVDAVQMRVV